MAWRASPLVEGSPPRQLTRPRPSGRPMQQDHLWGKAEGKPVWKLLADMAPERVVGCIDFRHITDALTREEALEILRRNASTKPEREREMRERGYPAYTTSAGWLGYSDEKLRRLCRETTAKG